MKDAKDFTRQAVVLLHGMGEQRPMDTLRSFVENVKEHLCLSDSSEVNTIIRSKPDNVSEIYETRRLSLSASRHRPITDFYELYWAHNMRNTKFSDILSWLWNLLFSWPGNIAARLKAVWWSIWAILLVITLLTPFNYKIVTAGIGNLNLYKFSIELLFPHTDENGDVKYSYTYIDGDDFIIAKSNSK